jgi:hypothetical protein
MVDSVKYGQKWVIQSLVVSLLQYQLEGRTAEKREKQIRNYLQKKQLAQQNPTSNFFAPLRVQDQVASRTCSNKTPLLS